MTRVGEGDEQFPYTYVSREYFSAMGIPLLRGRGFTEQEVASDAPVMVVSEGLARRLFGEGDAIGKRVPLGVVVQPTHSPRAQPVGLTMGV